MALLPEMQLFAEAFLYKATPLLSANVCYQTYQRWHNDISIFIFSIFLHFRILVHFYPMYQLRVSIKKGRWNERR